jgi:hypothetical protein
MNMSYCRFQNTAGDFQDCLENLHTLDPDDRHPNTDDERWARRRLIMNAALLMQELDIEDVFDTHDIERKIDALDKAPVETSEYA